MLRKNFLMLLCASALTLLPACGSFAADYTGRPVEGRVVRVADGDTITLLTEDKEQVKIRFSGIDAPEKGQPWGQRSRQSMGALVAGRIVSAYVGKTDRYGRSVAVVFAGGEDVGLEQLRRGLAWAYTRYLGELPADKRREYLQAEREARQAKRGLWSDFRPQAPWEWRKSKRAASHE